MMEITEKNIIRECVIGIITIEHNIENSRFVGMTYLTDANYSIDLEAGDRVIGVVQAPAGTFEVYGVDDEGKEHRLGMEFGGATNHDWKKLFASTLERKAVKQ